MKSLVHTGPLHTLAEQLDAATHDERVTFVESLGRSDQRALWKLAEDADPLLLTDFVPDSTPDGVEVRHHGFNTLLLPRWGKRFRKSMTRMSDGRIGGYNDSPFVSAIGPGFFTTRICGDLEHPHSTVVVDYHQLPVGPVVEGWPGLRPNWMGLQILVYFHTRDYMRRVSQHVTIGKATKYGWSMGSWFALVREDG